MLNLTTFGAPTDRPALLIAHGLYGSARNWRVIAKRLSDIRQVHTVDLRNHGLSPHLPSHSYPDLAEDLAEVIQQIGGPVDICGHSMGGKAAMALALTHPALLNRAVVADIAPVAYDHSQLPYIHAMRAVDLSRVARRSDAEAQLAALGVEPALQSFFTQSLDLKEKRWLLNLDVLEVEMPKIMGWPDTLTDPFPNPTLFLSGGNSDYVRAEHRDKIRALFLKARFAKLPGAGHWLHAEKAREFEASLRIFLEA